MSGAGRKYYGKGKGKGKKSDDSGVPTCSKCGNTTNLADKVSSSEKNPGKHYWKCMAKDEEGTWCNGFAGWVAASAVVESGDQSEGGGGESAAVAPKRKATAPPAPTLEAFEELEEQVKESRVKLARVTKRVDALELLRSAAEAPTVPPPTQLDHEEEIEDDQ